MKKDISDNGATTIRSSQKVILDFLDRDIAVHPERLQPVTGELVRPNNTWEPRDQTRKNPSRERVGFWCWWSRRESNPRPQVLYRQIYILSLAIWI